MKKFWNNLQDKYEIFCPYFWRDLKYNIKCRIFPRNDWARKAIPNQWHDLDAIFENVLFAGIINYVEGEKCFESLVWDDCAINRKNKKKIEEIYKWAKTGRAECNEALRKAYPIISPTSFQNRVITKETYEELYGDVNRLEKLLFDTDTKHLVWLVRNRTYLWT